MVALALVLVLTAFGLQTLVQSPPKASAGSYTPAGNWWAVDSVSPINATNMQKVRDWYQGGTPQVWGRYISDIGGALTRTEMTFASQNGIYLYLLVADRNNSSPLVCGRDLNASDAVDRRAGRDRRGQRARHQGRRGPVQGLRADPVRRTSHRPPTSRPGTRRSPQSSYKVGFYGNSFSQNNQFPKAYLRCRRGDAGLGRARRR